VTGTGRLPRETSGTVMRKRSITGDGEDGEDVEGVGDETGGSWREQQTADAEVAHFPRQSLHRPPFVTVVER